MDEVIVDDELRARLNGLNETLPLRDPAGRRLGFFVPEDEYLKLVYAWEKSQPCDLEELKRISREPGGRSLAEFWKSMGRS